jgi:hypothetical protein
VAVAFYTIKQKAISNDDTHTMSAFLSLGTAKGWTGQKKAFKKLQVSLYP